MSQNTDNEWTRMTMQTTLYVGGIVRNIESIDGKEKIIFWHIMPGDGSPIPGIVPIRSFIHSGRAVSDDQCKEKGLAFDLFVKNNYFLLIDKSYSSIHWLPH